MTFHAATSNAPHHLSRRGFLRHSAGLATAAGLAGVMPYVARGNPLGANERLGVGFIGIGGRSTFQMRMFQRMKNPGQVVALCDAYRPRLEGGVKWFGGKPYADYRDLLADKDVDVVFIGTPDHHHGYQAIDAIKAGKDVYCEKPIVHWRQFDLLKRVVKTVNESVRVFQVGTQAMSDSAWTQMKQLVADGVIGKPIFAETGYFRIGDTGERGMPVDNWDAQPGADLNWEAFLGDAPKRPFEVERFFQHRRFLDYAGGPCTDIYPHSLTPVVDILGVKFPEQVVASGGIYRYGQREVPDTFSLLIEYPEKLTIAVLGTIGNDYQNGGTRGSGQKIPVIRGHDGTLTVQGEEIVYLPLGTPNNKRKRETWPIERPESLEYYWEQFLDAVRSRRRQTVSSVDLAYRAHTPLLMGMLSWRHGKAAKFDAEKEQIIGLN